MFFGCLPSLGGRPIAPYTELQNRTPNTQLNTRVEVLDDCASPNFQACSPKTLLLSDLHIESTFSSNMADIILTSAICSHAAYSNNSMELEACLRGWAHFAPSCQAVIESFDRVLLSKDDGELDTPFVVAYTDDAVFIAFRGAGRSGVKAQTLTSFQDIGTKSSAGEKAFSLRVNVLDHVPLSCLTRGVDDRLVVFCGHSMGGAMAHAVQLQYLLNSVVPTKCMDSPPRYNLLSVAFGAPHFCNEATSWWLEQSGLSRQFITVINQDDPIPGIMEDLHVPADIPCHLIPEIALSRYEPFFETILNWLCVREMRDVNSPASTIKEMKKVRKSMKGKSKYEGIYGRIFAPAGAFIHLSNKINAIENVHPGYFPVDITEESLSHHALLGPEGYASQVMQFFFSPYEDIVSSSDRFSSSSSGELDCFGIVQQPTPYADYAILDGSLDARQATICIYGQDLNFLTRPPKVLYGSELSDGDAVGSWKIVEYSVDGSFLRLVMDSDEEKFVPHSCGLMVEVSTAFEIASCRVVDSAPPRDQMVASDMWLQSVEALALLRGHLSAQPEQLQWVQRALRNLAFLARVEDIEVTRAVSTIPERLLDPPEEFLECLEPLIRAVRPYLGSTWDMEMKRPVVEFVSPGTGIVLLEGSTVAVSTLGNGAANVVSVGLPNLVKGDELRKLNALGLRKVLRHTSRTDILLTLAEFVGILSPTRTRYDLLKLTDAEIEAEIVAAAIERVDIFGNRLSLAMSARQAAAANPTSVLAVEGTEAACQEAVLRVRMMVAVHRLFSLLSLDKHTFVAIVGCEKTGKSSLVEALGKYWHSPAAEARLHADSKQLRAYRAQENLWLLDFPGMNSASAEDRRHAESVLEKFSHLAHSAVVVVSCSNRQLVSDWALVDRMRIVLPAGGRILLVVNGADRYKHKIATQGEAFVEERREGYCEHLGLESEGVLFSVLRGDLNTALTETDAAMFAKFPAAGIVGPREIAEKISQFIL